jgi:hypothetical protein
MVRIARDDIHYQKTNVLRAKSWWVLKTTSLSTTTKVIKKQRSFG